MPADDWIATLTVVGLAMMPFNAVAQGRCKPSGVETERIICIEVANKAKAQARGPGWRTTYDRLLKQCQREFPGRGSSGRADRAICVGKRL